MAKTEKGRYLTKRPIFSLLWTIRNNIFNVSRILYALKIYVNNKGKGKFNALYKQYTLFVKNYNIRLHINIRSSCQLLYKKHCEYEPPFFFLKPGEINAFLEMCAKFCKLANFGIKKFKFFGKKLC